MKNIINILNFIIRVYNKVIYKYKYLKFMQTIKMFDKLIKEYYDHIKLDVFPELGKRRTKYDSILNKLDSFYYITNYISSRCKMETKILYNNALFTIYNKAALDLYGIFYCLYSGLEIQAGIIHRSLYETRVYTDFIFKDNTDEKIRLFFNFQYIERWNHIQESLKFNPNYLKDMGISEEDLIIFKEYYEKYKNDYHPKYPYHWAYKFFKDELKNKNPSLIDICKKLGEKYVREYISAYGTLSKQTHPSSMLGDYFTVKEQNYIVSLNSPMYKNSLVSTAVISISDCGSVILNVIKYLNVENYKEISEYINYYIDVTFEEGKNFLK